MQLNGKLEAAAVAADVMLSSAVAVAPGPKLLVCWAAQFSSSISGTTKDSLSHF